MRYYSTIVLVSLYLLLAISSADAAAADDTTKENEKSIWCYECTSVLHPGCADSISGSDKFPHVGKLSFNYSRDCSDATLHPYVHEGDPKPRAVGCRKILQEVDSKTRVVRECAYNKPDGLDEVNGLKRTGNQGVRLFYYQCPKANCNQGQKTKAIFFLSLILPVVLASVARW